MDWLKTVNVIEPGGHLTADFGTLDKILLLAGLLSRDLHIGQFTEKDEDSPHPWYIHSSYISFQPFQEDLVEVLQRWADAIPPEEPPSVNSAQPTSSQVPKKNLRGKEPRKAPAGSSKPNTRKRTREDDDAALEIQVCSRCL